MLRKVSLLILVVMFAAGVVQAQGPGQAGSDGIGDPYFPKMGNGGYDALHYTLDLAADVQSNTLSGTVTLEAQATEDLSSFNLDFTGFEISAVTLDGQPVSYDRQDGELIIGPLDPPLASGQTITLAVTYSGTPQGIDVSGIPLLLGWYNYGSGVFVASEPAGAAGWYPVNDHPLDKATYTFRITVPEPYVVAANGVLEDTLDNGDTTTYVWEMRQPMASYLATVDIDQFELQTGEGPGGLPIRNYFPPDIASLARKDFAQVPEMIAFFEDIFGPYPFDAYGVVVADAEFYFALETQSLSLFSRGWISGTGEVEIAVVHELSHQWFGDSVSPASWKDVWLNEGFATYASWLWFEHTQGAEALDYLVRQNYGDIASDQDSFYQMFTRDQMVALMQQVDLTDRTYSPEVVAQFVRVLLSGALAQDQIDTTLAQLPTHDLDGPALIALVNDLPFDSTGLGATQLRQLVDLLGVSVDDLTAAGIPLPESSYVPPGNPPAHDLFNGGVYLRGGLTLHALRLAVGDEIFFTIMKTYYDRYQFGNASTADFIAVAEEISGQSLGDLFDAWLYAPRLPDLPEMGLTAGAG
jgi:aminopeptidase N